MSNHRNRPNKRVVASLIVGAVLNILILAVVGGITVYKFIKPEEVALKAPDSLVPLEPPTIKYNQQKTKDRQETSQRPRQQQIKTRSINHIVTPDIDIQLSDVGPSVTVGSDMVDQLGGGRGLSVGGLRMGVSSVDFFGIKSKGERIVVIVEVSASMLEVRRGDIDGFIRVKSMLEEVIDGLNPTTLFNVITFERGIDVMDQSLVLANAENKERARAFMDPYWKSQNGKFTPDARRGVYLNNYQPSSFGKYQTINGRSRSEMALLAAFEQGADAIFMITDGAPFIWRHKDEVEMQEYYADLEKYERLRAEATEEERQKYERDLEVWLARQQNSQGGNTELDQRRIQQGMSRQVVDSLEMPRPPWGMYKPSEYMKITDDQFLEWIPGRARELYGDGRKSLPILNIIGYSIPERGNVADFMNNLRREFPGGQFRLFGEYDEDAGRS